MKQRILKGLKQRGIAVGKIFFEAVISSKRLQKSKNHQPRSSSLTQRKRNEKYNFIVHSFVTYVRYPHVIGAPPPKQSLLYMRVCVCNSVTSQPTKLTTALGTLSSWSSQTLQSSSWPDFYCFIHWSSSLQKRRHGGSVVNDRFQFSSVTDGKHFPTVTASSTNQSRRVTL
jgi:hypothetical protein